MEIADEDSSRAPDPPPPVAVEGKRERKISADVPTIKKKKTVETCSSLTGTQQAPFEQLRVLVKSLLNFSRDHRTLHQEVKRIAAQLDETLPRALQEVEELKVAANRDIPRVVTSDAAVQAQIDTPSSDDLIRLLEAGVSKDDLPSLLTRKWTASAYRCTVPRSGSVLESPKDALLLVDIHLARDSTWRQEAEKRIPQFFQLLDAEKAQPGGLIRLTSSLSFLEADDDLAVRGRTLLLLMVDSTEGEDRTASRIIEGYHQASARSTAVATSDCVFGATGARAGTLFRRLLEYELRRQGITEPITLYMERGRSFESFGSSPAYLMPEQPRVQTLVVKGEGRSYADLLRGLKTGVSAPNVDAVLSVRKGNGDNLEIRVRDTEEKVNALKADIASGMAGVNVARRERLTRLSIKDLDSEATRDDIVSGVKISVGCDASDITVLTTRRAFGNTQVATIAVRAETAAKLLEAQRIRIGWVSCRIEPNREPERCFRCWEIGHPARQCKGADRSKCCFNCGGEGHQARECVNERRCLLCSMPGHRTGDWKCVAKERQGSRPEQRSLISVDEQGQKSK